MLILTIRTDKPEAEIGLYDTESKASGLDPGAQDAGGQLDYEVWTAHRALAETIHQKIRDILAGQGKTTADIGGIVAYKGPGSFTGLRIGLTVANAVAFSGSIPIVSETDSKTEVDWRQKGIKRLNRGDNEKLAMPEYGADVHITRPKH